MDLNSPLKAANCIAMVRLTDPVFAEHLAQVVADINDGLMSAYGGLFWLEADYDDGIVRLLEATGEAV